MPYNMPIVVQPPPVVGRAVGTLLSTIDIAPPELFDVDGSGFHRWLGGVTFTPVAADPLTRIEHGCVVDTLTAGGFDLPPIFNPFTIYDGKKCSLMSMPAEELIATVQLRMSAYVSQQIEAELMQGGARPFTATNGTHGGIDHSLKSAAVVDPARDATAMTISDALFHLEGMMATALSGGEGIIHVPAGALPALQAGGGLIAGDSGEWRTATGHLVVGGAGYTGIKPTSSVVTPDADDFWLYGSGSIVWTATEAAPVGDAVEERINFGRNEDIVLFRRSALVMFDPNTVVAARTNIVDLGL